MQGFFIKGACGDNTLIRIIHPESFIRADSNCRISVIKRCQRGRDFYYERAVLQRRVKE